MHLIWLPFLVLAALKIALFCAVVAWALRQHADGLPSSGGYLPGPGSDGPPLRCAPRGSGSQGRREPAPDTAARAAAPALR